MINSQVPSQNGGLGSRRVNAQRLGLMPAFLTRYRVESATSTRPVITVDDFELLVEEHS
jgi:hypothetical protein